MTVYKRKSSGKRYAKVPMNGKYVYRKFDTEEEARKEETRLKSLSMYYLHKEAQAQLHLATNVRGSIAQVLQECKITDWANKPEAFDNAVRACRCLGFETAPAEISMQVLDGLVVDLREAELKNGTIRRYLSSIRVMLLRAIRMGWLQELPLFPEGRTLPLPEPRDLVLEDAWIHHLIADTSAEDRRLIFFLWKIGCRVDEALSLPWSRVSFDRRRIAFIKTKAANPRQIPMSDEIEALFMQCAKVNKEGPFMNLQYRTWYERYKKAVSRAVIHLGLDKQVEKEWVCHTLRHTCLTNLAMQGASAVQIKEWAGHTSLAISNRYIHSSAVSLDALAGVSSWEKPASGQQSSTGNTAKPFAWQ